MYSAVIRGLRTEVITSCRVSLLNLLFGVPDLFVHYRWTVYSLRSGVRVSLVQ